MILHQNPWLDHSGALRREYVDTPSLVGCCTVTLVAIREPFENKRRHTSLVTGQELRFLLSNRYLGRI
jgi:hypothetical protein